MVPNFCSAATTASANVTPTSGFSTSKTRRSANERLSVGTPSFSATADASSSRARSAAWMAALPVISVTRLE
jgi:hypothetical protein